jgi:hypothetical protein
VTAQRKWWATGAVIALVTLLWPGPAASADTSLGGYEAIATATVVHAEVFDPTIPIPATPQGDVSVAYTKSNVESGPTTRALASYVWPGFVVGDGFDQLTGSPGQKYPVQANSRFPATADAPAKNAVQLTDGNGMATSSDGFTTDSSVTLLGLAGPKTDLLGGTGAGLPQLGGQPPAAAAPSAPAPLPISAALATLLTVQHVTSTSTTTVADKTVTSVAHAAAASIGLLGGLISIDGVDVTAQVVSDGTKATLTGGATISGVTIAGNKIALDDKGLNIAGTGAALPAVSATLTTVLKSLGIELSTLPVKRTVSGAQGELTAKVLVITVDTAPLKTALNGPLSAILALLGPSAAEQLAPIISLGPKIVLTVGDVAASANASPAFESGGGSSTGGGGAGGGGSPGGGDTGSSGGGGSSGSGDTGTGSDAGTGDTGTGGGAAGTGQVPVSAAPVALHLPGLAAVPRMLVLAALAFAAIMGWGLRRAGGFLLGGPGNCEFGLHTGVPDLRKG